MKTIDILCTGEVLIDFIGHEKNATISETKDYHRFLGGSPTNVAVNAARLGLRSAIVASCGNDGLGDFIVKKLQDDNVDTSLINRASGLPTSIILVSKSMETPDFTAYREADCIIPETLITSELLKSSKIYHTTCFALSKNPARTSILKGAKEASKLGLQLSIDLNYSQKIWPDRDEAKEVIREYLSYNPLLKLSIDDCYRYFDGHKSDQEIFDYFHVLGVSTICLTRGKDGVTISDLDKGLIHQDAIKIDDIKDVTGAGDAFWAGFLYAQIQEKSLKESITIAQKLATIKLQNVGRLPDMVGLKNIINDIV
ncbi:carbohydrate kinase [Nonlabens arenilitoris]|uniref:Carbohydrate kinase n=1 Tax=Nonlabens arenilitoris TaxID=1217969 RepID=A0A2S7U994_9FLAO|nr:sugar kinase [Nonlabens arenilitoris]PQJ31197.1 carbohydrate kinase [Nonlabens arenilitoris]